jgi:hypothetical protein
MVTLNGFTKLQASEHGPGWRWHLARSQAAQPRRSRPRLPDQQVRRACLYLRGCAASLRAKIRAAQRFSDIAAAQSLAKNAELRDWLKILVLADCPRAAIAARLQVDPKVIETWERLFFDVRESRGAIVWIQAMVIEPERHCGNAMLAAKLKFAFAGGPVAAEAILDAEARLRLKDGEKLFDQWLQLHIKFNVAMDLPLETTQDKWRFLKLYLEFHQRDQRLEQEVGNLKLRSQEALWKQEMAQKRLEMQVQREEKRAARATERDAARRAREDRSRVEAVARRKEEVEQRLAAERRAAASPLAQLRWSTACPAECQATGQPIETAQAACA